MESPYRVYLTATDHRVEEESIYFTVQIENPGSSYLIWEFPEGIGENFLSTEFSIKGDYSAYG